MIVTLETFFTQDAPQEVIDLAAALGTKLVDEGDNPWLGQQFGSTIEELRNKAPNPLPAIDLEVGRVLDQLNIDAEVRVTRGGGQFMTVRFVDINVGIEV